MGYVLRRTRLLQRVATLPWNERQVGYGISGKFGVESVATLPWNRWQLSRGIRKWHYGMKLMAYTLINLRAFCGI